MSIHSLIKTSIFVLPAVLISGCLNAPDYDTPQLSGIQDEWVIGDTAVLAPGAFEASRWWEAFDDPMLTSLVEDAATSNLSLVEAQAYIAAAQAAVRASQASGFPLGELTGAVTRQQQSSASFGADVPFEFEPQTTYSVAAQASWEADFFGRVSNSVAQAEAALGGREAVAADASRSVVAQTATTYLTLRELDSRIDVSTRLIGQQENVLDLTRQLRDAGEVADIDVERQKNLIDTTRAGVVALRGARAETLSGLALLTGRTVPALLEAYPALSSDTATALDPIFAFDPIQFGTPEALLRRRPDIRAAERQLAAASYATGVATADLYPSISLTGQASLTALEPTDLFSNEALGYNFGPRLSWGIFNLPVTRARIGQAEAQEAAARAAFERTVLEALTETDAALQSYNFGVEEAALRVKALGSAQRALRLIDIRYREGAESQLSLLDAQRQALSAKDAEVQARYEALRRRVSVYRALGG